MSTIDEKVREAEAAQGSDQAQATKFIGGEVRILANPNTGEIMVNAPPNIMVAFGLLEMAKLILTEKHREAMQSRPRPAILTAKPGDIPPFSGKAS